MVLKQKSNKNKWKKEKIKRTGTKKRSFGITKYPIRGLFLLVVFFFSFFSFFLFKIDSLSFLSYCLSFFFFSKSLSFFVDLKLKLKFGFDDEVGLLSPARSDLVSNLKLKFGFDDEDEVTNCWLFVCREETLELNRKKWKKKIEINSYLLPLFQFIKKKLF